MKKGIVNALILVLCLINLVLTVIIVFTMSPAIKKTSTLVDKICEIVNLDVGGDDVVKPDDSSVSVTDLVTVDVTFGEDTTTTIALSPGKDGKTHYLKLGVSLNLNTKHDDYKTLSENVPTAMSMIDSAIIDVVSAYTYDTYDKTQMQNAVLKSLQDMFKSTFIYSVSFGTFTVQ